MKLLNDLLHTDYGLMSLIVILIVIAMWIYFAVLFMGKLSSPSNNAATRQKTVRKP